MTREEAKDWLCRLKSYVIVYLPVACHDYFFSALNKAIQAIDAEPYVHAAWIDVENGLPDNAADVLVCDIDGDIYMGYRSDHNGWRRTVDYENIKNVVAWMPLPEPYKGAAG